MKNLNEICVVIQARLSSQRIPRKMVKPFAGTTLMNICLDKLSQLTSIKPSQIFCSVHEHTLRELCQAYPFRIFNRSRESAESEGTPLSLIYEWWDQLRIYDSPNVQDKDNPLFKYVILINACCPFLSTELIDTFIRNYSYSPFNGMFGVFAKKNYFWDDNGDLITKWPKGEAIMNTKQVGITYEAAHCLYAGLMEDIGKEIWMGDFSRNNPVLFPVPEFEAFDIDYDWQFNIAETIFKHKSTIHGVYGQ